MMETKFYYIYEIWGKKIGCAENLERRMREQNVFDGRYSVLEVHTDIILASHREIELQKQYGYKVDKRLYYEWCDNVKNTRDKIDWEAAKAKVDWNNVLKTKRTPKIDYKKLGDLQRNKPKHSKEHIEKMYKTVNQYDLEGNFIKQWKSVKSAKEQYKGDVDACCRGKQKTAAGFIWKYVN